MPRSKYCTNCGMEATLAANFCGSCGNRLSKGPDKTATREGELKQRAIDERAKELFPNAIAPSKNPFEGTKAISGWLAYFILGFIVSIAYILYNAYQYMASSQHILQNIGVLFFGLAMVDTAALVFIFQRKRAAVYWTIAGLACGVVVYFIDALAAANILSTQGVDQPADLYSGAGRALILGVVWIVYFLNSKRVKATLIIE